MSSVFNNLSNNLKFKLADCGYWDFHLTNNPFTTCHIDINECTLSDFDFSTDGIFSGNTGHTSVFSNAEWVDSFNGGITATTFGLTGLDNGQLKINLTTGDTTNQILVDTLTGSTLLIPSGQTTFFMSSVTGLTNQYDYNLNYIIDSGTTGNYMNMCGGFYQGYFKLQGHPYQVLPERYNKGYVYDIWLRKSETSCTGNTINDLYPNNKGFFFYIGTRAENKFWNEFNGNNTGCTSGCTIVSGCSDTLTPLCTTYKEGDFTLSDGTPLSPTNIRFVDIENQFLIYHRGGATETHHGVKYPKGMVAPTFTGDSVTVTATTQVITDYRNPFLIYRRSSNSCGSESGTTVCDYSGRTEPVKDLDVYADLIDNAIGFRIKDDGSIGYRKLIVTGSCINDIYVTGITIEEKYSDVGAITENVWANIKIRWFAYKHYSNIELACKPPRHGKLGIYVNGKLKLWVNDFIEFIPKQINDHADKVITVPYNISLGGGSLGLFESITFDGQDPNDLDLIIEKNFAGTFIGDISRFKIIGCDLNWNTIEADYESLKTKYL